MNLCSLLILVLVATGNLAASLLSHGSRRHVAATPPRIGGWVTTRRPLLPTLRIGQEVDDNMSVASNDSIPDSADDDMYDTNPSALRSVTFASLDSSTEPQLLADFLIELGACSTAITDHDRDTPDEVPIFREPELCEDWEVVCGDAAVGTNVWRRCDVTAHFTSSFDLAKVAEMVKETFDFPDTPEYAVEDVPDRDWVIHVQSSWKPIVVSGFVLRFPWHTDEDVSEAVNKEEEEENPRYSPVQLKLEGGVAFGTGEHPTTRLCLGFLRDVVETMGARTILDYGAGSGVLGLAACSLSSDVESIGVEIDVDAIRIADRNAATNGLNMKSYLPSARLLDRMEDSESASIVMKGRARKVNVQTLPPKWDGPVFDACAANILAGPLIGLAGTISSMVRPGGYLGLSGVLKEQAEKVMETYSEYFDDVNVSGEQGGWVLITGTRAANCGMEVL